MAALPFCLSVLGHWCGEGDVWVSRRRLSSVWGTRSAPDKISAPSRDHAGIFLLACSPPQKHHTIYTHKMSDSEDGAGVPLIESISGSPAPENGSKRKRGEEEAKQSKRAKRRKNKKPKDVDDEDLDEAKGLNRSIGRMDSRLLADYMAQRTRRFEPDLSMVELEDRYVPGRSDVGAFWASASWRHSLFEMEWLTGSRKGDSRHQQLG